MWVSKLVALKARALNGVRMETTTSIEEITIPEAPHMANCVQLPCPTWKIAIYFNSVLKVLVAPRNSCFVYYCKKLQYNDEVAFGGF